MKRIPLVIAVFILFQIQAQISDFRDIDFTKADNIAKLNKGSGLENLPVLAYELTHKLPTKVEKFRAIYKWVCTNIKADAAMEKYITKKRKYFKNDSLSFLKWHRSYLPDVFKKLLKHKKTICTGYAYLIKELCYLVNIECVIINGYGRTVENNIDKLDFVNHSWNAVKLNGKWYLADPTWSSGYFDATNVFRMVYNDGYFLTDPILFSKNHHPSESKWLLDSSLINKSFKPSPLVYSEAFKHKVIPVQPETMQVNIEKGTELQFSFKTLNNNTINDIALVQFHGNQENGFKIYDLQKQGDLTSFKKKFRYKGSYDVHLKTNNDVVATYVIHVK